MVRLCAGEPKFIETSLENGFKISGADFKKAISRKTKILILNSPSNPCGSVYTEEELEEIAQVCITSNILVISDEIYEKIIFDGMRHISIAALNKEIFDLAVTVNGVSKAYSMTGWRIGYLGAGAEIIQGVSKIQDHSTSNPNSIAQRAALAAIQSADDSSRPMLDEFSKRRDFIVSRLDKMNKITYFKPSGAFYIFCNISKTGLKSLEFSNRLLEEKLIAVIPGIGFGKDDYVRLSFATSLAQIEKGMDRIQEWERQL